MRYKLPYLAVSFCPDGWVRVATEGRSMYLSHSKYKYLLHNDFLALVKMLMTP